MTPERLAEIRYELSLPGYRTSDLYESATDLLAEVDRLRALVGAERARHWCVRYSHGGLSYPMPEAAAFAHYDAATPDRREHMGVVSLQVLDDACHEHRDRAERETLPAPAAAPAICLRDGSLCGSFEVDCGCSACRDWRSASAPREELDTLVEVPR